MSGVLPRRSTEMSVQVLSAPNTESRRRFERRLCISTLPRKRSVKFICASNEMSCVTELASRRKRSESVGMPPRPKGLA